MRKDYSEINLGSSLKGLNDNEISTQITQYLEYLKSSGKLWCYFNNVEFKNTTRALKQFEFEKKKINGKQNLTNGALYLI